MMIVLLLLGACVCMGLSHDWLDYGDTYRMRLHRKAQSIEFSPNYNSDAKVLWKRDDPPAREDGRQKVMGAFYVMNNLTQKDSGSYTIRDRDQKALSTNTIMVTATTRSYTRSPGESLNFTFDLEPKSCNIYFFPVNDFKREIVHSGMLKWDLDDLDCAGFELLKPCGILNKVLTVSCSGRFEVSDRNGDKALVVELEMEPLQSHYDTSSYIGTGVSIFLVALCCRCCVKCFGGKSSTEKERTEAAEAEPAVHYPENDNEPRPDPLRQPSGTHYPARPSWSPTGLMIHNPPPVNAPPGYSEIHNPPSVNAPPAYSEIRIPPPVNAPPAYAEVSAAEEQADAPSVLVTDTEPRFELKGMTFPSAPPLSSDSSHCDVYTSDKLNFR